MLEGPRWYVAATHPGAERLALQSLARAGYNAYLPMQDEYRRDPVIPSRVHVVSAVMWPGYVLVEFDRSTSEWRPIPQLDGVRTLLGVTPERPTPIRRNFVEQLQATADQRCLRRFALPTLRPGDPVTVLEGPLAQHAGVCLWSSEEKVRIAAVMFGALREVTVDRRAVG